MNSLKLETLENALTYWENQNIIAELFFVAENNKLLTPSKTFRPLLGTEINSLGLLGRKIPNFELLRSDLGKGYFDSGKYLPRIPKKDSVNIQNLINDTFFFPLLPMVLADWVYTKKVCRVSQNSSIQANYKKNYLKNIPYDNFILFLDDPFSHKEIDGSGSSVIMNFSTFLISKEENSLRVYTISDEIKNYIIPEEIKKIALEATELANKNQKYKFYKLINEINNTLLSIRDRPHFSFISFDIDLDKPFLNSFGRIYINFAKRLVNFGRSFFGKYDKYYVDDISNKPLTKLVDYFENSLKISFTEFLNGFCKILLDLEPQNNKNCNRDECKNKEKSQKKSPDLEWNEVPLGSIVDISIDQNGKAKLVDKIITGSEKSYHVRAGHYRRYIQKDGSVKMVWVKSSEIRADKSPKFGGVVRSGVKTIN